MRFFKAIREQVGKPV